ncbi:MAG: GrpB family protein [Patescibacteria group bacterium]
MSKHDYSQRKYNVVPYGPNWPKEFKKIERDITPVFNGVCDKIEHIGSTSIPGMAGKPTIDVLVAVTDLGKVDALNDKMSELGYRALGEYVTPGSRLFVREKDGDRLVNIHCFPIEHPKVKRFISLRDYLRAHPEESKAYSKLKLDLFKKYPNDYGAYRKEKDAYMSELEKRTEAWSTK